MRHPVSQMRCCVRTDMSREAAPGHGATVFEVEQHERGLGNRRLNISASRMSRSGCWHEQAAGQRPEGESAGGISPPAALRTGRDSLPSSGPHSPACGERDKLPMSEEARLVLIHLLQPGHRLGVLAPEPLELVHGPASEMLVDAPCEEAQLGAVEGSVIVDPAAYLRIDRLREAGQVRATTTVEVPGPDLAAFRLLRLAADGRGEASEIASAATGKTAPEGVAQEVEAGVLEVAWAVRVLAVHDLRLHGVQLEAKSPEPTGDGGPQRPGLFLGVAVRSDVVRIALERAARELPVHPRIKRIMHEQVSQDGRNRGPLRGSLLPRDNGPVRHLHRRYQPPGDVQQDPSLAGVVSYRLQQQGMRNGVEKARTSRSSTQSCVQHRRRHTASAS